MSAINRFFDASIEATLSQAGLADFASIWDMAQTWFEPPNKRRNGWSGVSRIELPETNIPPLFVKRQENHNTRTLLHPIAGVPTYLRELNSILLFRKKGIPTLTPVYYGERVENGNHQAILITQPLDGYQDMFQLNAAGDEARTFAAQQELARVTWDMHNQGLAHYCLYPNHVFVRFVEEKPEIRLIDLEKVRRDPLKGRMRFKDLECYLRHSKAFSQEARQCFVDAYMAAGHVPGEAGLRQRLAGRIKN